MPHNFDKADLEWCVVFVLLKHCIFSKTSNALAEEVSKVSSKIELFARIQSCEGFFK